MLDLTAVSITSGSSRASDSAADLMEVSRIVAGSVWVNFWTRLWFLACSEFRRLSGGTRMLALANALWDGGFSDQRACVR